MSSHFSNVYGRTPEDFISNYAEEDEDGKKLKLFRYKGKSYPSFGDVAFSQLKDLKIRDDDLFLMGYLKTGCHWIYEVINMMRRREAKLTVNTKAEAFMDVCHPKMLDALSSPRTLNSHLTFSQLPAQNQPREMKRIAKFLEIEVADDLIKSICQATSMSSMKEANNKGFNVRKGQVGDWKNWLTVAQDGALDDVARTTMPGLSIYKPRFTLP
ncbi:uncharacterized protein LOC101849303 [Aplysia californica]|uniref:Uncharacterized protein LOC101849303 n=1 Tax=Aplysia californica TaxID=6500 RepID=A0ABM1VW25_APLCA|nr:uncharacterized protein LOC101849303 [Aplysia californica]